MANNYFDDISGKKFNMLTALKRSNNKSSRGAVWTCKCDCGGVKDVVSAELKSGNVKSCGCIKYRGLVIGQNLRKKNENITTCPECNIHFHVKPSILKRSSFVCCSMKCKNAYLSKNTQKIGNSKNRSDVERFFDEKATRLKSSAKKRGKEFDESVNGYALNDLWLKQDGKCFYSGIDMNFDPLDKIRLVSVDRVDNSIGYVPGNIVLCTYAFNSFKFNLTHEEVIKFVSLIKGVN